MSPPTFPKGHLPMSKKKAEVMDILDMLADLFWSNKKNGATEEGLVVFEGIDGNHHAEEYSVMKKLLLPNKGRPEANEGWSSEHELYLTKGGLKNSHSPFSYPTLLKQYKKYRELKPEGGWNFGPPLTRETIQEIMSASLTPAECRDVEAKYLLP